MSLSPAAYFMAARSSTMSGRSFRAPTTRSPTPSTGTIPISAMPTPASCLARNWSTARASTTTRPSTTCGIQHPPGATPTLLLSWRRPRPQPPWWKDLLAQQVLGLNPYIYWNRLVYAEIGGYRTLSPWSLSALGIPPPGTSSIDGLAPSWRLAVEPAWGNNTWEVGTFGLAASLVPQRISGAGSDHVTDVGFDTQYEFLGARDSFSLQARYILEYQDLSASQTLGLSTNSFNSLHSFHIKGTYYYKQMIGLTAGYFNLQGSSDPLLFGDVSANNSPNSAGWTFELDYIPFNYGGPAFWPWLNMKLGLQYIRYSKFDGASTNYDGAGTNASANNTLFAFAWFAF